MPACFARRASIQITPVMQVSAFVCHQPKHTVSGVFHLNCQLSQGQQNFNTDSAGQEHKTMKQNLSQHKLDRFYIQRSFNLWIDYCNAIFISQTFIRFRSEPAAFFNYLCYLQKLIGLYLSVAEIKFINV